MKNWTGMTWPEILISLAVGALLYAGLDYLGVPWLLSIFLCFVVGMGLAFVYDWVKGDW